MVKCVGVCYQFDGTSTVSCGRVPWSRVSDLSLPAPGALAPAEASRLAAVKARLVELISAWKDTGYTYSGAIYRCVASARLAHETRAL